MASTVSTAAESLDFLLSDCAWRMAVEEPSIKPRVFFLYSSASASPLVPPKKSLNSCAGKLTLSYLWGCEYFVGSNLSSYQSESDFRFAVLP